MRWLAYSGGVAAVAFLSAAGALYGLNEVLERMLRRVMA